VRASLLAGTSVLLFSASLLLGRGEAQAVIVINYPDFSSVAGLTLNGSALKTAMFSK
jgi:hypothetical protein